MYQANACLYFSKHDARHVQRDCPERNAVFVTKSDGLKYDINGKRVNKLSNSMHFRAFNLRDRTLIRIQLGPRKSKVEPVAWEGVAIRSTSPAVESNSTHSETLNFQDLALIRSDPVPNKLKLKPVSGQLVAVDGAGTRHSLDWSKIPEIEVEKVNGPVGGSGTSIWKITGPFLWE